MKLLIERYAEIAEHLVHAEDDPGKDGLSKFSWLYRDRGLDKITFDVAGFQFLKQKFSDPVTIPGFRIMLELVDFHVIVKVRPHRLHEAAKDSLSARIVLWLDNGGNGDVDALHSIGSAGITIA